MPACQPIPMKPSPTQAFTEARDFLLAQRGDHAAACAGFRWPVLEHFNWALDWFDVMAQGNHRTALWVVNEDGSEQRLSFAQMAERSNRVANWLRARGVQARRSHPADAAQRGGAVGDDAGGHQARRGGQPGDHAALRRRPDGPCAARPDAPRGGRRGRRGAFCRRAGRLHPHAGRRAACRAGPTMRRPMRRRRSFTPDAPTRANDPLLLYFTSGTTALAEDGAAHAAELSGRPPDDDVLAGPAPRRRAPEHQLAGLGQACVEQLLSRRGTPARRSSCSTRRASTPRFTLDTHRALRRDLAVRAADGVAHAHPRRPGEVRR